MSLIDNTYFVSDIEISGSILGNSSSFDDEITRYESEILKSLLGYPLYKQLQADLVDGEPQSQIYKDLVDGAEFTFDVCGETVTEKWEGLRGLDKKSLIAYYVYFKYRNANDSFYSGAGQQNEALTENSTKSDANAKLVDIWNEMVKMYGNVKNQCDLLGLTLTTYGSVSWRDTSSYTHFNDEPSAYNFLLANLSDYPTWVFSPIFKINQFDI